MGPRDHNRLHWVARYGSVHVVPWTRLGKYLTFSLPLLAARTSRSARAVIRSAAITPNERLPFCRARACRVIPRSFRLLVHRSEAHRMSSATATPPIRSVGSVWLLGEPRIQSPRSLVRIGNVVAVLLVLYTLFLAASLLVPIAAAVLLSLLLERARVPHAVRRMGTGGYRALATPGSE
jgi:hypothetical protein